MSENNNLSNQNYEKVAEQAKNYSVDEFRDYIKGVFSNSVDVYCLKKRVCGCDILITKIDNITSDTMMSLILMSRLAEAEDKDLTGAQLFDYINSDTAMPMSQITATSLAEIKKLLLMGFALIYIEGQETLLGVGLQSPPGSTPTEASGEGNLKGSALGFTLNLRTNMGLLRQLLRSPELVFETGELTGVNRGEYMLCYHKGIAPPKLIKQVQQRIKQSKLQVVFDTNYMSRTVQQRQFSLFTATGSTERPATAAAKICEGKVVLFIAGSPFALIYPYFFSEHFVTLDDYAARPYFATFIRLLKYIAFVIATLLPACFIAAANYHPELFTSGLLQSIAYAEQSTPLALFAEAIIVTVLFEIVREAGLRLPKQISSAVSFVSALIVGDAAIKMGVVSSPVIIVVALSTIAAFVVPSLYEPIIALRLIYIIASGIGGPLLLTVAVAFTLLNICSVKSYGIPYTETLIPPDSETLSDGILKYATPRKKLHTVNDALGESDA